MPEDKGAEAPELVKKIHWLLAEREDRGDGMKYDAPPMPLRMGLDAALMIHNCPNGPNMHGMGVWHTYSREQFADLVRNAGKYAIRAATDCAKVVDFEPDAMLQSLVVGLIGYWTLDGLTEDPADWWANPADAPGGRGLIPAGGPAVARRAANPRVFRVSGKLLAPCQHCGGDVRFSTEHENFYCIKCNQGQGVEYYARNKGAVQNTDRHDADDLVRRLVEKDEGAAPISDPSAMADQTETVAVADARFETAVAEVRAAFDDHGLYRDVVKAKVEELIAAARAQIDMAKV
jgi:hypothetical protein